ncbi:penicillin-binding protein [Sphingomonas sp. SRS2]|nr:penicillin-binding protein [Sphingomonas sp. SRS2]
MLILLWLATWPPVMPAPEAVGAAWRPTESWLYDRQGRLLESRRVDFSQRRLGWAPIGDIAPALRQMVIAAEDRRFASHGGVDWLATAGSIRDALSGRRARGASTISMQLAAYLAPQLARPGSRGLWQKARQMRAAMAIEARWSKAQILEAYLNLAGFRGEAQGVTAASRQLFDKPPSALSHDEAALLTALLPNPQAPPERVAERACRLVPGNCRAITALAAQSLGSARRMRIDPGLAPHLAARLLDKPGMRVATTIDADIQRIANAALARQLIGLGDQRARDGAVIVLDNATGDTLAYVGGVGGGSTASAVDGAGAPRQAGSTLKPFLYAAAFERGYLTAGSILDDNPVQLDTASGLYVPQNYDRGFKGPVSARSALAASLNVPAVRTLLLVGVNAFRDHLWDIGYKGLTEEGDYYGFSLALGSAEVTLTEQANAFRTLANGGRWSAARLIERDPDAAFRAVITPAAAWITADILSDPGARAGTFGLDSALRLPFWTAVKTGTSKAMRDNWCIGFSARYTVAVWIGNLEGDSMRAVSGTSGAAPVWRELMLALHRHAAPQRPAKPADVESRPVRFAGNIEPPRTEYFLRGTGQPLFGPAPPEARRARITSPLSGSVYALDPDIPIDRQRIRILVSGAVANHRLILDRRDVGPAAAQPLVLPGPGAHRLILRDAKGRAADQILFTVR